MRTALPVAALGLVLALIPCAQAKTSESFEATVVGITDGDTITVRVSNTPPYTIRLAGIDAPEKGQAFGDKSKKNLSNLVSQKQVRIEWKKKDGYGRLVGKVLVLPTALDVNLAQVSAGYAWHYKQYEKEQSQQDRLAYTNAEQLARGQKLGLWRDTNPVPPWEWRHGPAEDKRAEAGNGLVKKSRNDICHDPSMKTYPSVQHFTSFPNLEACIASGGRLPKKPGS